MKDNYLEKIKPAILTAGKKAKLKWENFDRLSAKFKSGAEIVTSVDKETEKYIVNNLNKFFPGHSILGEEYGAQGKKSDYLWIIDPIDGTTNFSIHNPLWSISLGLAYKGEIIFGIIYIPVLNEIFWASKGKGAFLNNKKINNKTISANKAKSIHTFCHGYKKRDLKIALEYYKYQKTRSLDCRQLGSAAIELAYVAAGRIDSIVIPGARSWDVAAGALIAKESGMKVLNFKNQDWTIKDNDILAAKEAISSDIIKTIKKITK